MPPPCTSAPTCPRLPLHLSRPLLQRLPLKRPRGDRRSCRDSAAPAAPAAMRVAPTAVEPAAAHKSAVEPSAEEPHREVAPARQDQPRPTEPDAGSYAYSDDDWGPPRDEDAPPLEEEPPMDWDPSAPAEPRRSPSQPGPAAAPSGKRPARAGSRTAAAGDSQPTPLLLAESLPRPTRPTTRGAAPSSRRRAFG